MHAQLVILMYVFVAVFFFLGGICVLMRLLARSDQKRVSRDKSDVPHSLDLCAARDEFELRAAEQPPLMPPPLPMNEFEFYQAGQYATDRNLPPLPSPPPKRERDN